MPSTTWTELTRTNTTLAQPETLVNDTNTVNVSSFGKGYFVHDRPNTFSVSSSTSTTWSTASPGATSWTVV